MSQIDAWLHTCGCTTSLACQAVARWLHVHDMLDACQRTARCISTCRSLHVNVLSMRCISTHLWLQVSFWCARREPPCSGREFCTKVSPQHAQNQVPIHHDVTFTRSLSRSLTSCLTSFSCCLTYQLAVSFTHSLCCITYSLDVLYHLPTRCIMHVLYTRRCHDSSCLPRCIIHSLTAHSLISGSRYLLLENQLQAQQQQMINLQAQTTRQASECLQLRKVVSAQEEAQVPPERRCIIQCLNCHLTCVLTGFIAHWHVTKLHSVTHAPVHLVSNWVSLTCFTDSHVSHSLTGCLGGERLQIGNITGRTVEDGSRQS